MKDVKCPYCGAEEEINHDDGYGYEEGMHHTQQCGSCHKEFVYFTSIHFSYDVQKADCLNGGEHKWLPSHTIPKAYTHMECEGCGEIRSPTDEERIKYEIPYPQKTNERDPF